MKKLNITWDGIYDPTGYLFSFAKSLSAAVKNSPYPEFSEDIIAASGFAFRMWVAADLCPSAMSIWEFNKQKPWVENGGLACNYIERLWNKDDIEEIRRNEAIEIIMKSIDNGIPAISWDIGIPEWGLVTGYDESSRKLEILPINGKSGDLQFDKLGKCEIPILSVLTITGKNDKNQDAIISDTLKLAFAHLQGKEWCENAKGLEAYPALISHFEEKFTEPSWQMEYYLGTYGALKYYAYKYFDKYNLSQLSQSYKQIYDNWIEAFKIKSTQDINKPEIRKELTILLKNAYKYEKKAAELISNML